jgi:hypothetical protein
MTDLEPCPSCRRHVRIDETACPFCATALTAGEPRTLKRGRFSRAAVFAGAALVSTAAGCGGKSKTPETGGGDVENAAIDAGPGEAPVVPDAEPAVEPPDDYYDHPNPMPYGAPPVRQRIV